MLAVALKMKKKSGTTLVGSRKNFSILNMKMHGWVMSVRQISRVDERLHCKFIIAHTDCGKIYWKENGGERLRYFDKSNSRSALETRARSRVLESRRRHAEHRHPNVRRYRFSDNEEDILLDEERAATHRSLVFRNVNLSQGQVCSLPLEMLAKGVRKSNKKQ